MTWKDITIEKFYKIKEISDRQDENIVLDMINCIYDIDSYSIPITSIGKYSLDFLNEKISDEEKVPKHITLNGRKYIADLSLTDLTASQFVDFQNNAKSEEIKYENVLSVFVFPDGHKYNDGYDLLEVRNDLLQMSIVDAVTICKFFFLQFKLFAEIFRYYLTQNISKMNLTMEEKMKIEKIQMLMEEINFQSLEYYLF